jgi:FlaA1/EpsC-like NDP-sugar epimerase
LLLLRSHEAAPGSRVMLIGAGNAGQMLLRDIHSAEKVTDRVVCIIDDNPNKWNRDIDGVPIVGGRSEIMASVKDYRVDKIYLAIPSATAEQRRDILNICKETGCELKNLPGMYQFVLGQITASAMKEVSVEDLLGREPIKADMDEVFRFLHGKVVMVTGGGGSIGSELCRQIAAHDPKQLIIFDIYENNAYDISWS